VLLLAVVSGVSALGTEEVDGNAETPNTFLKGLDDDNVFGVAPLVFNTFEFSVVTLSGLFFCSETFELSEVGHVTLDRPVPGALPRVRFVLMGAETFSLFHEIGWLKENEGVGTVGFNSVPVDLLSFALVLGGCEPAVGEEKLKVGVEGLEEGEKRPSVSWLFFFEENENDGLFPWVEGFDVDGKDDLACKSPSALKELLTRGAKVDESKLNDSKEGFDEKGGSCFGFSS